MEGRTFLFTSQQCSTDTAGEMRKLRSVIIWAHIFDSFIFSETTSEDHKMTRISLGFSVMVIRGHRCSFNTIVAAQRHGCDRTMCLLPLQEQWPSLKKCSKECPCSSLTPPPHHLTQPEREIHSWGLMGFRCLLLSYRAIPHLYRPSDQRPTLSSQAALSFSIQHTQ